MGSSLSPEILHSFVTNLVMMDKIALDKQAVLPMAGGRMLSRAISQIGSTSKGAIGDVGEAVKRVLSPIEYGLPTGYKAMSLRGAREGLSKADVAKAVSKINAPREGFIGKHIPEWLLPRQFGREGVHGYQHLKKPLGIGKILAGEVGGKHAPTALGEMGRRGKILAEEASRRGWTGAGELTKYLPVGHKGLTAAFTAAEIPGIISADKATPTGEGAFLERGLGTLGGLGGMVAGTGVGFIPGMAMYLGGHYLGGKSGRILDRLRSGASVGQAIRAPSPAEAEDQLRTIQEYYGG